MAQVTVGDSLAQLRAVEKKGGVEILAKGPFIWSITPADGSIGELGTTPTPDAVTFLAKAPGTAVVMVVDTAFPTLAPATLTIEVLSAVVVPDTLEIEFTPGT